MAAENDCCSICNQNPVQADLVQASTAALPVSAINGFTVLESDTGKWHVYDCGAWLNCGPKKGQMGIQFVGEKPVIWMNSGSVWANYNDCLNGLVQDAVGAIDPATMPGFCDAVAGCPVPTPAPTPTPTPTPGPTPAPTPACPGYVSGNTNIAQGSCSTIVFSSAITQLERVWPSTAAGIYIDNIADVQASGGTTSIDVCNPSGNTYSGSVVFLLNGTEGCQFSFNAT